MIEPLNLFRRVVVALEKIAANNAAHDEAVRLMAQSRRAYESQHASLGPELRVANDLLYERSRVIEKHEWRWEHLGQLVKMNPPKNGKEMAALIEQANNDTKEAHQ